MRSPLLFPALALAVFFVGATEFMLSTMLLPLATAFHTTPAQAAWLVSSYAFSYCIAAPVFGFFADRIPRRRLLLIALLLFALDSLALTAAPNFEVAIALRVVGGLASAALVPTAFALIADTTSDAQRQAAAMGYVMVGMTAGIVMGPVLAGVLTETLTWRAPFFMVAVGCLCTLAMAHASIPVHVARPNQQANPSFSAICKGNISRPLIAKGLWNGSGVAGFLLAGEVLRQRHGLSVGNVGLSISVFGAGLLLGNLSVATAIHRLKHTERVLITALLLLSIAVSVFMLASLPLQGSLFFLMLWGVALGLAAPTSTSLLASRSDVHKGQILSLSESLNNLTILLILPAAALQLERFGAAYTMPLFGSTLALAILLSLVDRYYQHRSTPR